MKEVPSLLAVFTLSFVLVSSAKNDFDADFPEIKVKKQSKMVQKRKKEMERLRFADLAAKKIFERLVRICSDLREGRFGLRQGMRKWKEFVAMEKDRENRSGIPAAAPAKTGSVQAGLKNKNDVDMNVTTPVSDGAREGQGGRGELVRQDSRASVRESVSSDETSDSDEDSNGGEEVAIDVGGLLSLGSGAVNRRDSDSDTLGSSRGGAVRPLPTGEERPRPGLAMKRSESGFIRFGNKRSMHLLGGGAGSSVGVDGVSNKDDSSPSLSLSLESYPFPVHGGVSLKETRGVSFRDVPHSPSGASGSGGGLQRQLSSIGNRRRMDSTTSSFARQRSDRGLGRDRGDPMVAIGSGKGVGLGEGAFGRLPRTPSGSGGLSFDLLPDSGRGLMSARGSGSPFTPMSGYGQLARGGSRGSSRMDSLHGPYHRQPSVPFLCRRGEFDASGHKANVRNSLLRQATSGASHVDSALAKLSLKDKNKLLSQMLNPRRGANEMLQK